MSGCNAESKAELKAAVAALIDRWSIAAVAIAVGDIALEREPGSYRRRKQRLNGQAAANDNSRAEVK